MNQVRTWIRTMIANQSYNRIDEQVHDKIANQLNQNMQIDYHIVDQININIKEELNV